VAKKKKAKVPSDETHASGATPETSSNGVAEGSGDGSYESPYIKELYK
jgi:hypothetical protein